MCRICVHVRVWRVLKQLVFIFCFILLCVCERDSEIWFNLKRCVFDQFTSLLDQFNVHSIEKKIRRIHGHEKLILERHISKRQKISFHMCVSVSSITCISIRKKI